MNHVTTHKLKCDAAYFDAIAVGDKTFEIRWNDRCFQRGDILELRRMDNFIWTGDLITAEVTYVLSGIGLREGFVALAIQNVTVTHERLYG